MPQPHCGAPLPLQPQLQLLQLQPCRAAAPPWCTPAADRRGPRVQAAADDLGAAADRGQALWEALLGPGQPGAVKRS